MSPTSKPNALLPTIIWGAMMAIALVYIAIGHLVTGSVETQPSDVAQIQPIITLVATLLLIGGTLLWRRFGAARIEVHRRAPAPDAAPPATFIVWMVSIALVESAAVMTLILSVASQDPQFVTVGSGLAFAVMLLLMRPRGVVPPTNTGGRMPGVDTTDLDRDLDWQD